MLGIGASADAAFAEPAFAESGCEPTFLITIGAAVAFAGTLFVATTSSASGCDAVLEESGLLSLTRAGALSASADLCAGEEALGVDAGCVATAELGTAGVVAAGTETAAEEIELGVCCGATAAGFAATLTGALVPAEDPNFVHAAYAATPTSAIAATAISSFLLPPLEGSASFPTVPPKVSVGAGDEDSLADVLETPTLSMGVSSSEVADAGMAESVLFEVETIASGSRAGAGALVAPAEGTTENLALGGAAASGALNVASGLGLAPAGGSIFPQPLCAAAVDEGGFGVAECNAVDSADSTIALEAEAATLLGGASLGAGMLVDAIGAAGRAAEALGFTSTGLAAGAEFTGFTAVVAAGVAGFAESFLRRSPRATRSVPLACSTLMGLVRTRFAPIRKAFATPACPSTTATASADWFDCELRALLNSSVAFCSLSQSTTTASKCSAINFFTAAKGSVQEHTSKSNSLRTCVTVRAVFSSGQKRSAW
jgi:hypothetical protein